MSLKFSLTLTALDRISAPLKRIRESAQRMTQATAGISRGTRTASAGLDALRERTVGADSAIKRMQRTVSRMRSLARFGLTAEGVGFQVGRLTRRIAGLTAGMAKWAAIGSVGAIGLGLKGIIATASEFEKYQTMLETVEGSQAKAKSSMAWVTKFAVETPYELGDVMDAFVRLKAYGIDPTSGALNSVGDAAAGMNTSLMQAVEALADAQTGEFERLKEFGITTKQAGDKVTFNWNKNGRAMVTATKKNAADIQSALMDIFDTRFGGGMRKLSGTFSGMVNNLKDKWTTFKLMIANAGFFNTLKERLSSVLGRVNAMAADGRLQAWAERISAKLSIMTEKAFDFVKNTDWKRAADGMMQIASAALAIVRGVTNVIAKTSELGLITRARLAGIREANPFSTKGGREDARALRQAAERELGRPVTAAGEEERTAAQAGRIGDLRRRTADTRRQIGALPLARGLPPVRGRAGLLTAPSAERLQQLLKPHPVAVGGKVGISVKASPELTARLDRIESANRNVPLQFGSSGYGRAATRGLSLLGVG